MFIYRSTFLQQCSGNIIRIAGFRHVIKNKEITSFFALLVKRDTSTVSSIASRRFRLWLQFLALISQYRLPPASGIASSSRPQYFSSFFSQAIEAGSFHFDFTSFAASPPPPSSARHASNGRRHYDVRCSNRPLASPAFIFQPYTDIDFH